MTSPLPSPIVVPVTFTVVMVNPRPSYCCQCRQQIFRERGFTVQLTPPTLSLVFCRKCYEALSVSGLAGQTPAPGQGGQ